MLLRPLLLIFIATISHCLSAQQLAIQDHPHPRLIWGAAQSAKYVADLSSNQTISSLHQTIVSAADDMLSAKPVEYKKTGRRLLSISRKTLERTTILAYAYRTTNDRKYGRRLEKELLAAAAFKDWNPSHFLDVAEMTMAMGIGYDWCFDALPDDSKKIIEKAIIEKGIEPSLADDNWWITADNNWNQVCHAGISIGAMAIYEHIPQLADQIITRAVDNLPKVYKAYEPDGAYVEGAGYWDYGTAFHVLFIDAYQQLYGDVEALKIPKSFFQSADFLLHTEGAAGRYNYADCGKGGGISVPLFWMAKHSDREELLWYQWDRLTQATEIAVTKKKYNRVLPFAAIWLSQLSKPTASKPKSLSWTGNGLNPVSMHRTDWSKDAIYIGIKGGAAKLNHAHMDAGSFVLDANGVRWAMDLGSHDYNKLESQGIKIWNKQQNSQRWEVFRYHVASHNTLMVNEQAHRVDKFAQITESQSTKKVKGTKVDMTAVFGGQLKQAERSIGILDNQVVLVKDALKNGSEEATIRWAMMTWDDIKINKNEAIITKDGQSMQVTILAPKNAIFYTYSAQPDNNFEDQNPGKMMLGFETLLTPNEKRQLIVEFAPKENSKIKKKAAKQFLRW